MTSVLASRDHVVAAGFSGLYTIAALQASRPSAVPDEPGVYLLLRDSRSPPVFVARSTGGWFKGRDPSVGKDVLQGAWVPSSQVLYIGKAATQTLRKRLAQYFAFGGGRAVGHWGGRYVWHLADAQSLLVAWKVTEASAARATEKDLIAEFAAAHGKRPFANLVG